MSTGSTHTYPEPLNCSWLDSVPQNVQSAPWLSQEDAATQEPVRALKPGHVVVGISAARLWGLPTPPSEELMRRTVAIAEIEHEGRRSRGRGVTGHRLLIPKDHVTTVHGVQVTSVARTWVDCAALMKEEHLLAMGDCALARELLDPNDLEVVLRWAGGRRGIRRARHVAPLVRPGVESPQESRLRWLLLSHGLPEPEINPWIIVHGQRCARLDLAYTSSRIGIEYDGDWHATTQEHDGRRRMMLAQNGWAVVVAHKEDLDEPGRLLRHVRQLLQDRRASRRRRW